MTEFEAAFQKLYSKVEACFAHSPKCHDFDHTVRVLRNAQTIAGALPEADPVVVNLAALLHDIARADEIRDQGKTLNHAAAGALLVPEYLRDFPVGEDVVSAVAEAVRTHRYRDGEVPATLEAKIVYDADKIDALGAVGIGRAFLFAGRSGARLHNTRAAALASEEYSEDDTAYREYLVKLRHLPGAMLTEPGREIAKERFLFMREFFARMNQESAMPEVDDED